MESHKAEKLKIASVVRKWESKHYDEFLAFSEAQKVKTANLINEFAEIPGDGMIMRLLYEIPETLDVSLNHSLDEGEKEFLKSAEGGKWFAKTFKQYNVSKRT